VTEVHLKSPVVRVSEERRRTAEVCHFESNPDSDMVGPLVLTTQNSRRSHAA
jgi:hypothetical protein